MYITFTSQIQHKKINLKYLFCLGTITWNKKRDAEDNFFSILMMLRVLLTRLLGCYGDV